MVIGINDYIGEVYLFEIVIASIAFLAIIACIVIAYLFLKNRNALDEKLYDLYEVDEDEARRIAKRIFGFKNAIDEYKEGELIKFPERRKEWLIK